jgi:hypothetical protein
MIGTLSLVASRVLFLKQRPKSPRCLRQIVVGDSGEEEVVGNVALSNKESILLIF